MEKRMNRFGQLLSVSVVAVAFSACGGGGGGGAASNATPVTPPAPTTIAASIAGVKFKGATPTAKMAVARTDGTFIYNHNGQALDITLSGIQAGGMASITENGIGKVVGGTTYSYSRFGYVTTNPNVPRDLNGVVSFYTGLRTVNMPTVGSATYYGKLMVDENINFYVNYGNKTIASSVVPLDSTTNLQLTNGTIHGNTFSGTTRGGALGDSMVDLGSFEGGFFGPNAEELAGMATVSDGIDAVAFSFGAKK